MFSREPAAVLAKWPAPRVRRGIRVPITASLHGGTSHDREAGLSLGGVDSCSPVFSPGRCPSGSSVRLSRQQLRAVSLQLPARMEIMCPCPRPLAWGTRAASSLLTELLRIPIALPLRRPGRSLGIFKPHSAIQACFEQQRWPISRATGRCGLSDQVGWRSWVKFLELFCRHIIWRVTVVG